jgi:hypothetical protein
MPPRTKAERDEAQQRQEAEAQRIAKERAQGAAALDQAKADEAAKTDEQKAAEEELARQQQEEAARIEADRVAAEQRAADEALERAQQDAAEEDARRQEEDRDPATLSHEDFEQIRERFQLPADTRILKAGTILLLNGEPAACPVDIPIVIAGAANEQVFASVLARDAGNFGLNADRLRLVYNPMNGTPLPLGGQRLTPEEMTEQERALFGL